MAGIRIAVNRLQVGNYVKLPVDWKDHPFLFSNFKVTAQEQITLIQRLGIKHVIIVPDKSDTPPLTVDERIIEAVDNTDDETLLSIENKLAEEKQQRIERLKEYRRSLIKCEDNFKRSLAQVRGIMNKLQSQPLTSIKESQELINDMAAQLLGADQVVLHLMSDSKEGEDLYYHALNVSILAMMLGRDAKCNEHELQTLGMGALFHDIGKLKIPTQILRKTTPLTNPEKNLLREHPRYGMEFLNLASNFPNDAKGIVLRHHEKLDGSGYPEQLKSEQIDPLTQIISVVNAYDNLCHPFDIKRAKIPFSALSYLFKECRHLYNETHLSGLIRLLGIYPPGSVVQLSDGKIGLVMSVNSNRLLYPSVMIYDPDIPRNEAPVIDLEEAGLSIDKVVHPNKLPTVIFEYLSPRARISYYFDPNDKK